jgi:serine/threonine-protein kinase
MVGLLGQPDGNNLLTPRLSPDGRRAAVSRTVQGNTDIWVVDAERTTRFTFDPANETAPIWSADGSQIAFISDRKGTADIYIKPSSGAATEELMMQSAQIKVTNDFSSDGRFLVFQVFDPMNAYDIWVKPLESNQPPRAFLNSSFDERGPNFSPDGRWMSYRSNESVRTEIYVRPFPGPGGQWQVSTAGGGNARWHPDGTKLYYIAPDARLMEVPFTTQGATFQPGTPVPLFQTRVALGGSFPANGQYDVAPDGRFLVNASLEDAGNTSITLLQNWRPESGR